MNPSTPASGESGPPEAELDSRPSDSDGHKRRTTSAFVLAGRVLLLLLTGLAVAAGVGLTRQRDRARALAEKSASVPYLCPMHPEVVSPVPADCPICGMALERASGAEKAASATAAESHRFAKVERRVIAQVIREAAWTQGDGMIAVMFSRDELVGLSPGERALFFARASPAAGRPAFRLVEAPIPRDATTVWVRFLLDGKALPPTTGWLQLDAKPRELLVVPESAVLYSGEGAYVLAAPPNGRTFTRRNIEVGRTLDAGHVADLAGDHFGLVVVLSGLAEGERVIASDTFLLDAERRLQAAQGRAAEVIE
jgi:hypothetical protein